MVVILFVRIPIKDTKLSGIYTETDELIPQDESSKESEAQEVMELLNILLGGEEETPDEGGN